MDMSLGKLRELLMHREAWEVMGMQTVGHNWAIELNWMLPKAHLILHSRMWMKSYSTIKNNTFELILMMWINLEPMTQNEASEKEKKQIIT